MFLPMQVCDIFKNSFSIGIGRYEPKFPIEPYESLWCMCEKPLQHYVSRLIDAVLSVISGFITVQRILAIDCDPLFSSLEKMTKSYIFRVTRNTKFSEKRRLIR